VHTHTFVGMCLYTLLDAVLPWTHNNRHKQICKASSDTIGLVPMERKTTHSTVNEWSSSKKFLLFCNL